MSAMIHEKAIVESKHVGDRTRVWPFAHVMPEAVIGSDCNIGECCFIENGTKIGDRVTVKNGVSIWEGVQLEDNVFVGPNAVFTNVRFPISRNYSNVEKTLVKQGACLGANSTVVCGVTIGRYALIGAGSVVTRDIPDYALAYGNPAKVVGYVDEKRNKVSKPPA